MAGGDGGSVVCPRLGKMQSCYLICESWAKEIFSSYQRHQQQHCPHSQALFLFDFGLYIKFSTEPISS